MWPQVKNILGGQDVPRAERSPPRGQPGAKPPFGQSEPLAGCPSSPYSMASYSLGASPSLFKGKKLTFGHQGPALEQGQGEVCVSAPQGLPHAADASDRSVLSGPLPCVPVVPLCLSLSFLSQA